MVRRTCAEVVACRAVTVAGRSAAERDEPAVPFMGAGRGGGAWHIVTLALACRINGIPGERLRVRRHDQLRANREMAGDPREVIGPKRNAAFRWAAPSSPAMHKDRRTRSRPCVRPVPIRQQHEVVKPVWTPKPLVGRSKGCPHHVIVGRVSDIIAPAVIGVDHFGPWCRSRYPVGTIEHPDNPMDARWRAAVSFTLLRDHAISANGAGKAPLPEPKPGTGKNDDGRPDASCSRNLPPDAMSRRARLRRRGRFVHSRCPDFLALTLR